MSGRKCSGCCLGVGILIGVLGFVAAQARPLQSWKDKPAADWTLEETLALLSNSPWAREVTVSCFSGRLVEGVREDERHYISGRGRLTIPSSTRQIHREPERVHARYRVWWSSAPIVQQARERLRQLVPPAVVEANAPPFRLSTQHYVVTVRVVRPPAPPGSHLFQGLNADQLQAGAVLRTSEGLVLQADRVERSGMGAGASLSFFFLRQQDARQTLLGEATWVEFEFKRQGGQSLKVKFDAQDLQ